MMKRTIPFLAVLCLSATFATAEPVTVSDVAIDKLLDGVRVTIVCAGSPNVSSFTSAEPPAVIIDVMDATVKTSRERFESAYYPVSGITVQPSEATSGVRITVRLRDMVEHQVATENGTIVVDFGTTPVAPAPSVEQRDAFAGKRLTLYVKDAEIADILRMIASQFDLNILTTQDVKSLITVRLNDVPLRVGLDALVKAALANIVEGKDGILVVKPEKKQMYGELQTRVFDLDHTEAQDALRFLKPALSASGSVEIGYRRVSSGGGSDRNSSLIVTDIPEALDNLARIIADIDRPVPQVAIEAKFIETTVNNEDRFGIEWNLRAAATSGDFNWGKDFGFPLVFNNMVLGKVSLGELSASLDLLASRGRTRVLANPSTITLDNQTAKMTMSTDVPTRQVSTDPKTGLVMYTWNTQSIPIELEVTPHVTADGMVVMKVRPNVEAITGYVGTSDDQRPIVARRTAETQVIVADGEAAVIGGLTRDEETRTIGKIPLLGDIPILGHLFKKTTVTRSKNDLMIFIIPHIMPAEG
jgi:type IV pilus assembly protein PilQ